MLGMEFTSHELGYEVAKALFARQILISGHLHQRAGARASSRRSSSRIPQLDRFLAALEDSLRRGLRTADSSGAPSAGAPRRSSRPASGWRRRRARARERASRRAAAGRRRDRRRRLHRPLDGALPEGARARPIASRSSSRDLAATARAAATAASSGRRSTIRTSSPRRTSAWTRRGSWRASGGENLDELERIPRRARHRRGVRARAGSSSWRSDAAHVAQLPALGRLRRSGWASTTGASSPPKRRRQRSRVRSISARCSRRGAARSIRSSSLDGLRREALRLGVRLFERTRGHEPSCPDGAASWRATPAGSATSRKDRPRDQCLHAPPPAAALGALPARSTTTSS